MQVKDFQGKSVIDSRDVARMVEKEHKNLLRDIAGYIKIMSKVNESNFGLIGAELKIEPGDFFIESTYLDGNNQSRPCYLITKKDCDMIANKLTGEKGVLFTAAYVTAFEDMDKTLKMGRGPRTDMPSPGGLAKLIGTGRRVILDMGGTPVDVGCMMKDVFRMYDLPVPIALEKQLPGQLSIVGFSGIPLPGTGGQLP